MVLKMFTTFIVVAAILASPKHRDFTWSYRSSIYRVHWFGIIIIIKTLDTVAIRHSLIFNRPCTQYKNLQNNLKRNYQSAEITLLRC